MHGGVIGIRELIGHKGIRRFAHNLARFFHRAHHPLIHRSQNHLSAIRLEDLKPLIRHRIRHDEDHAVTLDRAHHGKPNPRIAARGLHDHRAGLENAPPLRLLHHVETDPVLDAAARIERLKLRKHRRRILRDNPIEPHQRRIPHKIQHRRRVPFHRCW